MKKISLSVILFIITASTFAQKYIPIIKKGSVLNFSVNLKNIGQSIDLDVTIVGLDDPIKMHWNVPGYGGGEFEMLAKALQSAKRTVLSPPTPGAITKLKEDETLMVLSKALYSDATTTKAFELNNIKFTVIKDTAVYKINNKATDIFHAVSEDKKSELWVLNSPDYPIICQAKNITRGIDYYLTSIKE
jgi:hypothetical protein